MGGCAASCRSVRGIRSYLSISPGPTVKLATPGMSERGNRRASQQIMRPKWLLRHLQALRLGFACAWTLDPTITCTKSLVCCLSATADVLAFGVSSADCLMMQLFMLPADWDLCVLDIRLSFFDESHVFGNSGRKAKAFEATSTCAPREPWLQLSSRISANIVKVPAWDSHAEALDGRGNAVFLIVHSACWCGAFERETRQLLDNTVIYAPIALAVGREQKCLSFVSGFHQLQLGCVALSHCAGQRTRARRTAQPLACLA